MGIVKNLQEKVWHQDWEAEELRKFAGEYKSVYFTYSNDESIRNGAASGGSVSTLLIHMLESQQIDGALVLRTIIRDGKARPEFFIATTREEVLSARGSKYSAVYFTTEAFPLIQAFEGKLAIVALPCDAKITHAHRQKNAAFDEKIKCVITLFCGHNSEPELTDGIVDKLRPASNVELVDYVYRSGNWRGNLTAKFDDGTEVSKPFSYFSDYRNVYFFAQKKCHHCFDHFGYYCDISAGDIWSPQMKNEPIKHTALVTRTDNGQAIVESAIQAGALWAEPKGIMEVVNGQARTAPFHYNITSRARVGRLMGIKIVDRTKEKVRWNDYIVAFMALVNEQFSKTPFGRRLILMIPRPLIRLYVYVLKGLESI